MLELMTRSQEPPSWLSCQSVALDSWDVIRGFATGKFTHLQNILIVYNTFTSYRVQNANNDFSLTRKK